MNSQFLIVPYNRATKENPLVYNTVNNSTEKSIILFLIKYSNLRLKDDAYNDIMAFL